MSEASAVWHVEGVDPNTYAYVAATALFTSIAFTVAVLNVLAVVLSHVLG
jgi:hypothetical protein